MRTTRAAANSMRAIQSRAADIAKKGQNSRSLTNCGAVACRTVAAAVNATQAAIGQANLRRSVFRRCRMKFMSSPPAHGRAREPRLTRGHPFRQLLIFGYVANFLELPNAERPRIDAEHSRRAARGPQEVHQQLDGGRLARPVRTDECEDAAGRDVEVQAPHRVEPTESARQPACLDDVHRRTSLPCPPGCPRPSFAQQRNRLLEGQTRPLGFDDQPFDFVRQPIPPFTRHAGFIVHNGADARTNHEEAVVRQRRNDAMRRIGVDPEFLAEYTDGREGVAGLQLSRHDRPRHREDDLLGDRFTLPKRDAERKSRSHCPTVSSTPWCTTYSRTAALSNL